MTGTLAVVADVHGNRWALQAVLEELARRDVDQVIDLGDVLFGPLDPGGTLELLRGTDWPTVRGNQDRQVIETGAWTATPTNVFTRAELGADGVAWLAARTVAPFPSGEVFACHGDPHHDDHYLLEVIGEGGVRIRDGAELDAALTGVDASLVLCAHAHVPRLARSAGGAVIVNPGSVGLPAYADAGPPAYAMEAGSPEARFALVEERREGWTVEHVAVPYDHESAARAAASHGRADWADWLRTGRARVDS